jgi:serine protease AprX
VITVGASNDEGSVNFRDDRVPSFSSLGPTRADGLTKPDVVSPGVHTVSLRSPGSAIDNNYGSTARVDGSYFRGTGTSMSTGTVSGAVAQMLQRNPGFSPDDVKYRLKATARDISDTDPNKAGAGLIDAYAATNAVVPGVSTQVYPRSTGLGSLALDRGGIDLEVVTPLGQIALLGEFTAQTDPSKVSATNPAGLFPYIGLTFTQSGWEGTAWKGTAWKDEDWAGTAWKGTAWKATVWDGTAWKGTAWKNSDWEGTAWKGTAWKGTAWKSAWYAVAWE